MFRIDPVLLLLFAGMVVFTAILLFVEHFFKDDGQIFQVMSGLVTGFAGAFFTRLKPQSKEQEEKVTPPTSKNPGLPSSVD